MKPATVMIVGGSLFLLARSSRAMEDTGVLPRTYDPLFRKHCSGIPVPYLRALAKRESDFDPDDASGPAWGLMQVTESVRREHNARSGDDVTRPHLLNPDTNVRVACGELRRILTGFARHPRSLSANWKSRRWVELFSQGWNAGWSDASGVGFVVGTLESRGVHPSDITIDSVHSAALELSDATRFLRIPGRVEFARKVANTYFREIPGSV